MSYSGTDRLIFSEQLAAASDCVISVDGTFIVSDSDDNTLKTWDVKSRVNLLEIVGQQVSHCWLQV